MKKRALLIVGLALMIAAAGVVYALWTDTLAVTAAVGTGDINTIWQEFGTDDDGISTNDPSGNDDGQYEFVNHMYNAWGAASSADPAEMWRCRTGDDPRCAYKLPPDPALNRYDKDVAKCTVTRSTDMKTLTATITDAYPSYHCSVFSQLSNEGNVPVKSAAFHLNTPEGTLMYAGTEFVAAAFGDTATCNLPANAGKCPSGIFVPMPAGWTEPSYLGWVPVITFDFADGTACGNQLDPYTVTGDNDLNAVWFHVEEAAAETATYSFSWQQDFVNWNEWKAMEFGGPTGVLHANSCQIYINGTPMFTP